MRPRKIVEHETRVLRELYAHDRLAAHLVAETFRRQREEFDVFGNPCRCLMDDEGEWQDAFCPEHEPTDTREEA